MYDIKVKAIRSVEELQFVGWDYDTFLNTFPNDTYFLRRGWIESMIEAWAFERKHAHGSKTLFLLLAYRGDEIIGAMPLQLHKKRKGPLRLNRLHGLGINLDSSLCCPKFEFKILRTEFAAACLACFWNYLVGLQEGVWDILDLDLIPEPSQTLKIMDRQWPAIINERSDLTGAGFELPEGQAYEKLEYADTKFRSELRRKMRKLIEDHGNYEVLIDSATSPDDWEEMGRVHSMRQTYLKGKGMKRYSLFDDPFEKPALTNAMHFAEKEGMAVYYRMKINGRLAAFQICVQEAKTLYHLVIAFDQEFSRYAPGKQLMAAILKDACLRQVRYVDYLPGLGPVKSQFSNRIIPNKRRVFLHPSLKSHLRYRLWSWGRDLRQSLTTQM